MQHSFLNTRDKRVLEFIAFGYQTLLERNTDLLIDVKACPIYKLIIFLSWFDLERDRENVIYVLTSNVMGKSFIKQELVLGSHGVMNF